VQTTGAIIETLLCLDKNGDPAPYLATDWKISSDYKSITLTLGKGIKFHDGTDFNAAAVKYNLDANIAAHNLSLMSVSSVDVVDDYTVRLNLTQFSMSIMSYLAISSLMVSPAALQNNTKEWIMDHPVGTGPFKLVSFQRDVSLKLEKFADYWQEGKPYLDGIEFTFVADPFTAMAAFKSGTADILMSVGLKDVNDLINLGYVVTKCPAYMSSLAGDSANPESPFANLKVRQAISYAIDRESLVKGLGYGILRVANQPANPNNGWYNPDIKGYPYDPDKARSLLKEAGYTDILKTTMIIPTSKSGDMWVQIQQNLKAVGIEVELQNMNDPAFMDLRSKGWKDSLIFFDGFFTSIGADEGEMIKAFLSRNAPMNVSVGIPDDYDAKLTEVSNEYDAAKRKVLMQELMKIVIDVDCMAIPICENYIIGAKSSKVHGDKLFEIWAGQWTPADGWLSK
jgi:peptide/nickel transport system substrate-binding protein